MASFIARSILRRTSRFQVSSSLGACFSSQAFSSQSKSLVRRVPTQRLWYPPPIISLRFASFKVEDDENLLKVLQTEIDCVQEPKNPLDTDVPKEFPFEIIDRQGDQTMTLKREYGDENIQLTVYMNLDQEGTTILRVVSLHITIDKGQGFILEFGCKLTSDELEIESMASSSNDHFDSQEAYQGPEFSDLDENLQKALHKYLEVRGINSSLYRLLYEYMINKDEREYLKWLKKLKEFILK